MPSFMESLSKGPEGFAWDLLDQLDAVGPALGMYQFPIRQSLRQGRSALRALGDFISPLPKRPKTFPLNLAPFLRQIPAPPVNISDPVFERNAKLIRLLSGGD